MGVSEKVEPHLGMGWLGLDTSDHQYKDRDCNPIVSDCWQMITASKSVSAYITITWELFLNVRKGKVDWSKI